MEWLFLKVKVSVMMKNEEESLMLISSVQMPFPQDWLVFTSILCTQILLVGIIGGSSSVKCKKVAVPRHTNPPAVMLTGKDRSRGR